MDSDTPSAMGQDEVIPPVELELMDGSSQSMQGEVDFIHSMGPRRWMLVVEPLQASTELHLPLAEGADEMSVDNSINEPVVEPLQPSTELRLPLAEGAGETATDNSINEPVMEPLQPWTEFRLPLAEGAGETAARALLQPGGGGATASNVNVAAVENPFRARRRWEIGSANSSSERQEEMGQDDVIIPVKKLEDEITQHPRDPAMPSARTSSKLTEEGSGSAPAWVVEMKGTVSYTDKSADRWATHSIFRVPEWIKNMTNKDAYRPWLVSLGPYHHGDPNLKPMEEHKRRAVWAVAKRRMVDEQNMLDILASVIDEHVKYLQEAYDDIDEKWGGPNIARFKEMMLTDGCFLLEIIRVFGLLTKGHECDPYTSNDPVFGRRGFLSLYLALKSDVIVMENQLPLLLLQKLQEKIDAKNSESIQINKMVLDFLGCTYEGNQKSLGLHPLDILHLSFCDKQQQSKEWGDWDGTLPSVTEIADAGIHFKKCNTSSVHVIDFQYGVLRMPEIEVNDRTEKEFLNLMAFERLYGIAGSNATAFMIFMDNLIDSERDVSILRSKGIIKNMLSSDKETAKLFNTLSKGALLSPSSRLYGVRRKVNEHCKRPWNVWRANFIQTYMRNPWVFTAFVASVLLLVATFLQTIYTVVPYYKGED